MTESTFAKLIRAKVWCGSVFSERRLKLIFVDGFYFTVQATMGNNLSLSKQITFTKLRKCDQALGDSHRNFHPGGLKKPRGFLSISPQDEDNREGQESSSKSEDPQSRKMMELQQQIFQFQQNFVHYLMVSLQSSTTSLKMSARVCWICASPKNFSGDCSNLNLQEH